MNITINNINLAQKLSNNKEKIGDSIMHSSIGYLIEHYFHQDAYIFIQKFLIVTGTILTIYVYIADIVYQYKLRKKEIEKQKEYEKLPKVYVRSHKRRSSSNRVYSVKGYYRVKKW